MRLKLRGPVALPLLLGLFLLYGVFAVFSPRLPFKLPRLCPFYLITGRSCPLCGLTRALGLCSRGQFGEAFKRYPVALLSASLGLSAVAIRFWKQTPIGAR